MSIRPSDQYKTAFITPWGLFEFTRMAFGFQNAPATFQRLMQRWFSAWCFPYIDDLFVVARTEAEMLWKLEMIFGEARASGFKLNLEKSVFFRRSVIYIGRQISGAGVGPDPTYITKIQEWTAPRSFSELQSLVGTASFIRQFVANVADPLTLLAPLLRQHARFEWLLVHEAAFDEVKRLTQSACILKPLAPEGSIRVQVDASRYALGAVLLQEGSESTPWMPVEFFSRQFSASEFNWSINEKELIVIVMPSRSGVVICWAASS